MLTLIITLLSIIGYVVIAYGTASFITHVRDFDRKRGSVLREERCGRSKGYDILSLGDQKFCNFNHRHSGPGEVGFWSSVFLPYGILSAIWHWQAVEWSQEERQLIRKIYSSEKSSNVLALESHLDRRQQEKLKLMHQEIKRLEKETSGTGTEEAREEATRGTRRSRAKRYPGL